MKIKIKINQRKLRYGSYSIVIIILFIAGVIGLNLIINSVPVSVDLTPNKLFSTSEKTVEVLTELEKDIIIYAFFDEVQFKDSYIELEKLINDYTKNKHITIKYIDAFKSPADVKKIDPDNFYKIQPSQFLFASGDKKKKVTISDFTTKRSNPLTGSTYEELAIEETLTGAIIYVTAEDTPVLYFIQGHGEAELSSISVLNEYLNRNNFEVNTLSTLTMEAVPEDADMLIFLAPQKDITSEERIKIEDFLNESLDKNKAIMILIDPLQTGMLFDEINLLLENYNIKFNNDLITENDSGFFLPGTPEAILPDYIIDGYKVFSPFSRSVEILQNKKPYIEEEGILETSTKAGSVDILTGEITSGLKYVAVRTNYKGGYYPTRVFAIGNTYFLNDQIVANYEDNMQFMLDQIRWSLELEGGSIYIQGKPQYDTSLNISQKNATAISLALIIIIPLILFGIGTIIYVRRKNL